MNAPRGLIEHPCFAFIADALAVEFGSLLASGAKHRRIELATAAFSDLQIEKLRTVEIPCAACGRPISPFRERRGGAGRASRPSRVFVSVACPLANSIGCARGRAASDATARLAAAIEAHHQQRSRPGATTEPSPPRPDTPAQMRFRGLS